MPRTAKTVFQGSELQRFVNDSFGRIASRGHPRWKYFCWITMAVNLFTATGYFLFSGVGGFGDWAEFIRGLSPKWIWRIGLAIFGAVTYFLAASPACLSCVH